jgi:hypothetical protein
MCPVDDSFCSRLLPCHTAVVRGPSNVCLYTSGFLRQLSRSTNSKSSSSSVSASYTGIKYYCRDYLRRSSKNLIHGVTPAEEKQGNHTARGNPIVRGPVEKINITQ